MFPNVIAMPMPAPHSLFCFVMWATDKVLCPQLRAARREIKGDLVFGEEFGLEWEVSKWIFLPYFIHLTYCVKFSK